VNPFDVDATAEALYAALTAPEASRRSLGDSIRKRVRVHDIGRWLSLQIRDLRDLVLPEDSPDVSRIDDPPRPNRRFG